MRNTLRSVMENIEPRRLLSTVTGTVFDDANKNGRQDAGEAGLGARTVFADYNFNGIVDGSDPIAFSDASGNYSLATRASSVSVRVVTRPAEAISLPYGANDIWLSSVNGTVTGKNLGIATTVTSGPSVTGTVFTDANRNGRLDTGEARLAGRTVFADYNFNGRLDAGEASALTDAAGAYSITTRTSNVSLRLALNANESVSLPYGATSIWLSSVSGTVTGKNFGVIR